MPNVVNTMILNELKREFTKMGSCLVVSFDKLTVAQAESLRKKFRGAGLRYRVVKNRIAIKAFESLNLDLKQAFQGKCGVVIASEERAIDAARLVKEAMAKVKQPPIVITGGVIERQTIVGKAALSIADMPDRNTVRAQLCGVIQAPMRGLAVALSGLSAGLARVVKAKADKDGPAPV